MPAKTNDPSTWTDLHLSLKALATGRYNGIGFVFSESDPFTGTDLDACVSKEGSIAPWAQEIITTLSTYTEYSPSKLGVHCLTNATLPGKGRKFGDIEMYSTERFFTITADHVPGTPRTIEHHQEAIEALYRQFAPPIEQRDYQNTRGGGVATLWTPRPELTEPTTPEKPDEQVIQDALNEQRSNFARYWNGDTSLWTPTIPGVKPERKSPSEAFFTLLLMLLTKTGDNKEQVERLYLQSPFSLIYPKAKMFIGHDRETGRPVTYLESSIRSAIEKRGNPPQRR